VKFRFGLRPQLVLLFTVVFTLVYATIFITVIVMTTEHTTKQLRDDLDDTLKGTVKGIDGDETLALSREGTPTADGFSDDPRYKRQIGYLTQVHELEPRAFPYTMVRGTTPHDYVYLVDIDTPGTKHAAFLEHDTLTDEADKALDEGKVTDRPDLYEDKFGRWLTSYAPIRDHTGKVVALLGCDFEASYVETVQREAKQKVVRVMLLTYAAMLLLVYFAAGFFTRPVRELTLATENLGEDSLGKDVKLAKRNDELGALARAFNDMSGRLARAFRELARANEELEDRVKQRTAELAKEQEKSEKLLRNVLPEEIATRLKNEPQTIAEGFDAVTVAFADIVGFTELSARSSPIEVVRMLNEIFSAFDGLAEKYGLEKIKTIGDAYMVVGGLPVHRADHAQAVADMALEMQAFMRTLQEKSPGLAIRIGVHTGPVVAGVIGTKKFSYDLWGDTVNVASRMESHGERDRIQLSDAAAAALRTDFVVEVRGTIKVKGRGELSTHWLVERRSGVAQRNVVES
jgi:class 3 adenylate cyclase